MLAEVRPGEVLAGKYEVEHVLGRGGMGIVVAARHLQLDERVAVKLMLSEVAGMPDAVMRFVREARAAAKIKSEHVARVSDVGTLEGGQPYMVMEYLEGSDLGALLAGRGRFPLDEVAEYVLQALEAIAQAHALGIVHRDLKPSNLFLTRRQDGTPVVKVLDFGISKVSGSGTAKSDGAVTRTSALMGSPLYMSPEQMNSSRDVDARSDIWALGVIVYELLAGEPPFSAPSLPQVCALILEGSPAPIRSRVPELPEGLDAIIGRCLARDPNARYANVAELANALVAFAPKRARVSIDRIAATFGALGTMFPTSSDKTPVATAPDVGTDAAWGETAPQVAGRGRWALGLGLAFATLGAGSLAAILLHPTWNAVQSTESIAHDAVTATPVTAPSVGEPTTILPALPSTAAAAAPSAAVFPGSAVPALSGAPPPAPRSIRPPRAGATTLVTKQAAMARPAAAAAPNPAPSATASARRTTTPNPNGVPGGRL